MKRGTCLPLVYRSRLLRHPCRRFLLDIRHKKKSISSSKSNPASSLLSRFGRRKQKRDVDGSIGLLVGGLDVDIDVDACRSFEKYVMEVILEEGRIGDLRDVEELLHCWNNLFCPVLADIVATFYVEACNELFATTN